MPKITWSGDANSAIRAQEALTKAAEKYATEVKEGAKSAKQLEVAAKKIIEAVDPQIKLNRLYKELGDHVQAGRISIDQATAAGVKFRQELGLAAKAGKEVEQSNRKAFDPKIFLPLLGGLATVTGAVGLLKDAFGGVEQRAQEAADAVLASLGAAGELQQLGPEGFAKGTAIARQLVRSGAVSPQNKTQALDIATDLINAQFDDRELQFVANDLAASKLVKPENLRSVGGDLAKLQRTFGLQDLAQTTAQAQNAANKTQASLAETTKQVLQFATLASSVGVTFPESLAAFEAAESRAPSPEKAAENLKSFFSQVKRRGLFEGDLQGTLANIQSKIKPGKTAFDVLGDANAVIGFEDLLADIPSVTSREANIARAQFKRTKLLGTDPVLGAANVASIEKGRLASDIEKFEAERESLFDAVRDAARARLVRSGADPAARLAFETQFGIADVLNQEERVFRGALEEGRRKPDFLAPETLEQIEKHLARIAENTTKTEGRSRSKVTTRANDKGP